MGFMQDRAIVTETEVAQITFEGGLANVNLGAATVAALLPQATNAIMREIRRVRGRDPATVLNTDDFKLAAAHWVRAQVYHALPSTPDRQRKADDSDRIFRDEVARVVILTPDTDPTNAPKGLPVVLNLDAVPYLNRPVDNRRPYPIYPLGPWRTM